jgi:hypothetical protein
MANRILPPFSILVSQNPWHPFADPSLRNIDVEHCVLVTSSWLASRIWISSHAYVEVAVRDGDQIGIVISRSRDEALKFGLQILLVFSHWVCPHRVLDRITGFRNQSWQTAVAASLLCSRFGRVYVWCCSRHSSARLVTVVPTRRQKSRFSAVTDTHHIAPWLPKQPRPGRAFVPRVSRVTAFYFAILSSTITTTLNVMHWHVSRHIQRDGRTGLRILARVRGVSLGKTPPSPCIQGDLDRMYSGQGMRLTNHRLVRMLALWLRGGCRCSCIFGSLIFVPFSTSPPPLPPPEPNFDSTARVSA